MRIHRATLREVDDAYRIVSDYYDEIGVVARDDRSEFEQQYFVDGTGVWLAKAGRDVIGCIALRRLPQIEGSGEIKRLYVAWSTVERESPKSSSRPWKPTRRNAGTHCSISIPRKI